MSPGTKAQCRASQACLYFCLEFIILFGFAKCGKVHGETNLLAPKQRFIVYVHASISLSTALGFLDEVLPAKEPSFPLIESHLFVSKMEMPL